jgi:TRAP-type C4-dicarboxylate transport system substrate-binding protein
MRAYGKILAGTAFGALAAFMALPASSAEVTLSAISFLPNNSSFGKPFYEWVQKVNKDGKGVVQIDLKAAGSMSPFTMGNAIKNGAVDMANLPPTFYQNLLPIGDSMKLMTIDPAKFRSSGTWAFMNQLHNEKVNAYLLSMSAFKVQFHLYLRDKNIDNINLKGFKLRTTPVYRAFFAALGADLIQTPPAEVYTALERGTVDGYGWPLWDIKTPGWDKVTKYRVDPGFYSVANAFIINLDKWKSLPKAQQDFLNKEAVEFEKHDLATVDGLNKSYAKEQADAGVQVITLKGKMAEQYVKTAYDAAWAEAEKLDPVNAPKLKKLITK